MSAFGGDALQRKAMSHKSSFIIIDSTLSIKSYLLSLYFFSLQVIFKNKLYLKGRKNSGHLWMRKPGRSVFFTGLFFSWILKTTTVEHLNRDFPFCAFFLTDIFFIHKIYIKYPEVATTSDAWLATSGFHPFLGCFPQ